MIKIGMTIGERYVLLERLGEGASGQVYLAWDKSLEKRWAVKIFHNSERTKREIAMLRELDHEGIPRVTDYVEGTGWTGLVMDYLQGTDLASLWKKGRRFTKAELLTMGIRLCDILTYLHSREDPIVYRDLKPQNLLLTKDRGLMLVDFDCACRASDWKKAPAAGTRGYAAPEQYGGQVTDRSDLYSLGATLDTLSRELHDKKLNRIVEKCKREDPGKRFHSAEDVKKKLIKVKRADERRDAIPKWLVMGLAICILCIIMRSVVRQGGEEAYREALNRGRYREASFLFPDRIAPYEGILEVCAWSGRTEEGIALVERFINENDTENGGMDGLAFQLADLYMLGNPRDLNFYPDLNKAAIWNQRVKKGGTEKDLQRNLIEGRRELGSKEEGERLVELKTACSSCKGQWKSILLEELADQVLSLPSRKRDEIIWEETFSLDLLTEIEGKPGNRIQIFRRKLRMAEIGFRKGLLIGKQRDLEKSREIYRTLLGENERERGGQVGEAQKFWEKELEKRLKKIEKLLERKRES